MKSRIERLIRPNSIAVFGGSWAHSVIEQCQKMGYTGKLWPVHPNHTVVAGLPCYSSIDALPDAPDASFLGVNRELTIDLVAALAKRGAGGAVCFASGFSEAIEEDANAADLEQALLRAAGDMPVLGPNCYGFINCLDRALLWPDQHGAIPVGKGVAIVTQSSNIAINLTMQTRGLPIAYVFTAGNQASVTLAQLALTALEDDRVSALGLHIEGFSNIRDFENLAVRAKELGKPIVALKVGKSDAARQALKSHTSSLAGSDACANSFLKRLGIARVHSLAVLLETLKLFHVSGTLANKQLLSMSCSGGEACLMGDAALEAGLECPELSDKQSTALRNALGPRVALANPLDYHTYIWNDRQAMYNMFTAMLQSDAAIAVLVLDFPRSDRCTFDSWLVAIDAFKDAGKHWHGQLAVLSSLPENLPETIASELLSAGVVPFCGLDEAVLAISAATLSVLGSSSFAPVVLPSEPCSVDAAQIVSLNEATAKQWLASANVKTPNGILINGADDGADVSQCLPLQWPVVLKSTDSLHKTDSGGVVLDIANVEQLHQAIAGMRSQQQYFVEEQVQHAVCELLVGIVRDPVHGFLMTVAAGGIQTELLLDSANGLLPLSRIEIHQLLGQLRCFKILNGYRGRPGCNMSGLLDTLMLIQAAAIAIADDLHELEINPLVCTESDTIAVDAILRIDPLSQLNYAGSAHTG